MQTGATGSPVSSTVDSEGSKISQTVSAGAVYDGQSRQEAKNSGLVYNLW